MTTHNSTTDGIRAAYLAVQAARPVLDPHDIRSAGQIAANAVDWLRCAWLLVKDRPDLADAVMHQARQLKALKLRLDDELKRGQA